MVSLDAAALVLALLITIVEMTEVVALVFALRGETDSLRTGALGAIAGVAAVGLIALGAGAALLLVPTRWLLAGASVTLFGFGIFLFRSTRRAYRRAWHPSPDPHAPSRTAHAVQFGGGFSIGAIEALETVIVLLSISAGGQGISAIVGAVAGGVVLVGAAAVLHERIRRIKVPVLKLGATGLLLSYAVFFAGEAAGLAWPLGDLSLLPLFVVAALIARGLIRWLEEEPTRPAVLDGTKG